MGRPLSLLLLLLQYVVSSLQNNATPQNQFYIPISNMVWPQGSTQTVQWITNITTTYTIQLWQECPDGSCAHFMKTIYTTPNTYTDGVQTYAWTVDVGPADLAFSNTFLMYLDIDQPNTFNSPFFKVSPNINTTPLQASSAPTSAATSSTVSPSIVASSTSVPTSSSSVVAPDSKSSTVAGSTSTTQTSPSSTISMMYNTSTATSTSGATSPSTPTTINMLSLGIGLGIGVPLLLIIAILAFFLVRRNHRLPTLVKAPADEWDASSYQNEKGESVCELPAYHMHISKPQGNRRHIFEVGDSTVCEAGDGNVHEAHGRALPYELR